MSKFGRRRLAVAAAFIPAGDTSNDQNARSWFLAHARPYFAQCDPKIASGVMVRGVSGRETQVRFTK